jgi:hypothetical protein
VEKCRQVRYPLGLPRLHSLGIDDSDDDVPWAPSVLLESVTGSRGNLPGGGVNRREKRVSPSRSELGTDLDSATPFRGTATTALSHVLIEIHA